MFTLPRSLHTLILSLCALALATSGFATANSPAPQALSVTVGAGPNGERTITVSGEGSSVTLPDIQAALSDPSLLENQGGGVWQANASLFISRGVTLTLSPATVTWLKLRSQDSSIDPGAPPPSGGVNYHAFTSLRTYNGAIVMDGVRLTSWDPGLGAYDTTPENGRAFVLAKYEARLDIRNSELSYLGYQSGESYGVSWRDTNDGAGGPPLTRVTGTVENSDFSYNWYGVYTFQASNMIFRGNKFHHNLLYGFDPHDYSHDFVVEDNEAYENGNHGFILSRGCYNFVIRRNKSYNNRYAGSSQASRLAHGFMLDPGSPTAPDPQAPVHDVTLEDNEAWGNDGYGLRMLGANNNVVRNNNFHENQQGITVEGGSTANVIEGNLIAHHSLYGIFIFPGSNGNTLRNNTVQGNDRHGIYVKANDISVTGNTLSENGAFDGTKYFGAGLAFLESATPVTAEELTLPNGRLAVSEAELAEINAANAVAAAADANGIQNLTGSYVAGNTITANQDDGIEMKNVSGVTVEGNTVSGNQEAGIYLADGASDNLLRNNTITGNADFGIKANGADVLRNRWEANAVYENGKRGITVTGGANGGMLPPTLSASGLTASGTTVPGAVVDLYTDDTGQARYFEGRVTADAAGQFTFTSTGWRSTKLTAVATDPQGNSSGLSTSVTVQAVPSLPNVVFLPLINR